MTRINQAILRVAVACYRSRKARVIGPLMLMAVALLAVVAGRFESLTILEVTSSELPFEPLCMADFNGGWPQAL